MQSGTRDIVVRASMLGISFALVAAAAAFGAQFMPGDWYAALEKPPLNPPNWIFGPVWTLLYALMAVAAWLVWLRRSTSAVGPALALYGAQLVLNALWSWLFFGLHHLGLAMAELAMLWLLIAATLVLFWRVNRLAGAMLAPYLLWAGFAGYLNGSLWMLNNGAAG